jgi:hypothetical protein
MDRLEVDGAGLSGKLAVVIGASLGIGQSPGIVIQPQAPPQRREFRAEAFRRWPCG